MLRSNFSINISKVVCLFCEVMGKLTLSFNNTSRTLPLYLSQLQKPKLNNNCIINSREQ